MEDYKSSTKTSRWVVGHETSTNVVFSSVNHPLVTERKSNLFPGPEFPTSVQPWFWPQAQSTPIPRSPITPVKCETLVDLSEPGRKAPSSHLLNPQPLSSDPAVTQTPAIRSDATCPLQITGQLIVPSQTEIPPYGKSTGHTTTPADPSGSHALERYLSEIALYYRDKKIRQMLRNLRLEFRGSQREVPDQFLLDFDVFVQIHAMTLDEIRRTLPAVLQREDMSWFCRENRTWRTYEDFSEAFQLQYCAHDRQERLKMDILDRTQGPDEPITEYLSKLRTMMDAVRPPMPLTEQLDRAYANLHPRYRYGISTKNFRTFADLLTLGKNEELKWMRRKAYKPPPLPEDSLFPEFAYIPPDRLLTPPTSPVMVVHPIEEGHAKVEHRGALRPGCWNCGTLGHSWRACYAPRQRLCHGCGRRGETLASCPDCQE